MISPMGFRKIRPCEINCCKAKRNNRETEEEPLIEHASGRSKFLGWRTPVVLSRPASQSSALQFMLCRSWQAFLWAREQEILLPSRYAEPVAPDVLRENWYPG